MGLFHANSLEYNRRGLVSKVHKGVPLSGMALCWKMIFPDASFMSDLAVCLCGCGGPKLGADIIFIVTFTDTRQSAFSYINVNLNLSPKLD